MKRAFLAGCVLLLAAACSEAGPPGGPGGTTTQGSGPAAVPVAPAPQQPGGAGVHLQPSAAPHTQASPVPAAGARPSKQGSTDTPVDGAACPSGLRTCPGT